MNLAGSFDQVLKVSSGEEVAQVDELAVAWVLDVNDAPPVLTTADLLAVDNYGFLATNNGEGDDALLRVNAYFCA